MTSGYVNAYKAINDEVFMNEAINAGYTTHKARLGLGLFAAKRILEQHSGMLKIQIVSGKGCQTKLIFMKE